MKSATSGDIIVGPKKCDRPAAGRTQYGDDVPVLCAIFRIFSVIDNVAFALKMRGVAKAERHAEAKRLLELVDMQAYAARLPGQLSGGQQQRVALARALITSPQILLLGRTAVRARSVFCGCAWRTETEKSFSASLASPSSTSRMARMKRWALANIVVLMNAGTDRTAGISARDLQPSPGPNSRQDFIGGHNVICRR